MAYYTGFIGEKSSESFQNQTIEGEVVQIFEQTINIVLKKQFPNLLTMGNMHMRASPQSLAFPSFSRIRAGLKVGDACLFQAGTRLLFSDCTCSLEVVKETSLSVNRNRIDAASFRRKQAFLEATLLETNQHQRQAGFVPFYQRFIQVNQQLQTALIASDWLQVEEQVLQLIGLGMGLTPSGDDLLTGLMLILFNEQNLKEIIVRALERTNSISQHQLFFASQGRAKPSVLAVIHELYRSGQADAAFESAVMETLAIGSTSGHDLLTGVASGLQILSRKGAEKNEFSRENNSQSLH
ncbi:oxamate carbamoyltransferase subunit AllH family protein [Enterococcus sp. LJL98]